MEDVVAFQKDPVLHIFPKGLAALAGDAPTWFIPDDRPETDTLIRIVRKSYDARLLSFPFFFLAR